MPPAQPGPEIATARIEWRQARRVTATRYPRIDLFERVSQNPAAWDALIELEQLVNPRVRDAIGEIALVPPEKWGSGPNASWVMTPFTSATSNTSGMGVRMSRYFDYAEDRWIPP